MSPDPRRRGLFITIEGVEGVGKSTNIQFLQDYLRHSGVDLIRTREPGGTLLGEEVRDILLRTRNDPIDSLTELLLVFAARAQHLVEKIEPALAAGKWVLCDRFTDASYAYQGAGRGVADCRISCLEDFVGELRPDITILLDADIETGKSRITTRGEPDRIEAESTDFFKRVRERYLELADRSSGRYRVIDASQPLTSVQSDMQKIGAELLQCWAVRR